MGPLVQNTARDERKNITYQVMSPTQLTEAETRAAVNQFLSMLPPKKRPKRNSVNVIPCPIGLPGLGGGIVR